MASSTRSWWPYVAALACLLLGVWLYFHGRDDAPVAAPAATASPASSVTATTRTTPPPAAPGSVRSEPHPEREEVTPDQAPPITLPPDTEMLQAEFVPGTTEWEEVPLLEGSPLSIRFLPAHYNVVAPAPIVLYLEVTDGKQRTAADVRMRVRSFDHADEWIDVPVKDDGSHRYVGTLTPSPQQERQLLGRVVAEGAVISREAGTRRIPQALIYTRGPRARLTGRWRDEQKGGHLYLSAEVEVETEGQFTLMAELFGPNREPIALTRAMAQLPAGTQWMTMRVWGKALRDAGVPGPYEVRDVLLTRDMNERGDYDPGPTILSAHRTAAYKLAEFADAPYVEAAVAPAAADVGHPAPMYPEADRMSQKNK